MPRFPHLFSARQLTFILLVCLIGCSIFLLYSSASNLAAGSGNAPAQADQNAPQPKDKNSTKDKCHSCAPPGNQSIYIPLIDLPEAQGSELVFNSRSTKEMTVTPTFYKRNGAAIIGAPVNVQSAEIRYVNVRTLLPAGHRHDQDWGGMSLSFYGIPREMWSQFRFLGVNGGSSVDEFFIVPSEQHAAAQEAAWWMPKHSRAIIALGNITDTATSATVAFGDGETRDVYLAPHATEIIQREHAGEEGVESVKINITGAPGSIVPTGVIAARDGSFNSVIRFYAPNGAKQSNLFANGLRLAGVVPHMVLKNTAASAITAQPKFIPLDGITANPVVLPEISLGPNETTEVDLTALAQAVKHRNDLDVASVEVTSSGADGSLIGSLYVINQATGVNYDVPLRDSGPIRSMTGAYPWKISDDYKTVVYITNITDQEAEFVTQINYAGGKFILKPRKLNSGQTAVFDLQRMRDEQMQDSAGQSLPRTASIGQLTWALRGVTGGKIVLIGRTEMVSRSQQISTSYSCPMDCGLIYELNINPFPDFIFFNGTATGTAWETGTSNAGYSIGPYQVGASWSVDNPIATFDPSDGATTTATGTAVGTANLTAFVGMQERYDWDGLECIDLGSYPEENGGTTDVVPKVFSLQASVPSTKNAASGSRPDPSIFTTTNNSTAFATASTQEMAALLQSAETITVSAQGVDPSSALANLRWQIKRDPSDTVATGTTPTLSVENTLVKVTPDVPGNFILICYYDTNVNGAYDQGEELKVLRLAIVRATVQGNGASTIDGLEPQFEGHANGTQEYSVQPTGDIMAITCSIILEGGGANRLIGVNRIRIGTIQNLLATSSTVNYPVPNPTPPSPGNVAGVGMEDPGDQVPVIDCGIDPNGGSSVFLGLDNGGDSGTALPSGGEERILTSMDAPGIGPWLINHPTTHNIWKTTQGGYNFRDFISAFSTTFSTNYVVLAKGEWSVRVVGSNNNGTWTDTGSTVTISGATGGSANLTIMISNGSATLGDTAGVQVLGKSYNVHHTFTYSP